MRINRQLGVAAVAAVLVLTLTACSPPDVIGAAVMPQIETTTVTVTRTQTVVPSQCRQAIEKAYEIISDYDDLIQLNIDIMGDMIDEDWNNATMRMERALKDLDPIDRKKIELAGLGVYCQ